MRTTPRVLCSSTKDHVILLRLLRMLEIDERIALTWHHKRRNAGSIEMCRLAMHFAHPRHATSFNSGLVFSVLDRRHEAGDLFDLPLRPAEANTISSEYQAR